MAVAPWIVSDELWELIEPLLPKKERSLPRSGRKRLPDRQTLSGILFVLHTGIAWRHLPAELGFGSGRHLLAAPGRVAACRGVGEAARPAARATARGRRDRVDARRGRFQSHTGEKGGSETGPSPVDRGRLGSKHHLIVDARRHPARLRPHRRQPPRCHPDDPACRPDTGRARHRRPAAPPTRPTRRRSRLRLPKPPAPAPPARDQTGDRPPRNHARLRPGPLPLGRRAHLRLAASVPPPARPLRTPRRHPRSLPRHRLLPHLLPPTHREQQMKRALRTCGCRKPDSW